MLPGTFFVKNIKNSAESAYSNWVLRQKREKAPLSHARVKSIKMTYFPTAVTFFQSNQIGNGKVLQKLGCMLYHICKNEPKIPVLTTISDV